MTSSSLQWRDMNSDHPGGCVIESIDLSDSVLEANGKILHDLWCHNSIILVKGRDHLPHEEEYALCQEYYNELRLLNKKRNDDTDVESAEDQFITKSAYDELLKKYEQLEVDYFSLSSEHKDAKLTISNLHDDIEMEKKRNRDKEDQLAAFNELEEYSAGLREECGNLEDILQDLRVKYSDLEQSYVKLNSMNDELRADKNRGSKELEEKEQRIGTLEKELLILEHRPSSNSSSGGRPVPSNSSVLTPPVAWDLSDDATCGRKEVLLQQTSTYLSGQEGDLPTNSTDTSGSYSNTLSNSSTGKVRSQASGGDNGVVGGAEGGDSSPYHEGSPAAGKGQGQNGAAANDSMESEANSSGDDVQAFLTDETRAVMQKKLQQLEENNRRLLSRLKFLDNRLQAKEEAIDRMNGRIEEVIIERDSFREAMQGLLVGGDTSLEKDDSEAVVLRHTSFSDRSRSTNDVIHTGGSSSGTRGSKDNHTDDTPGARAMNRSGRGEGDGDGMNDGSNLGHPAVGGAGVNGCGSNGMPSNAWQAASLKGVMGSLLGAPVGTLGNPASTGTQAVMIQQLQGEIMKLRKEVERLSELKKLQPHVEELEKNLEQAEKAAKEAEKWADEEFAVLSNKIDAVTEERNTVHESLRQAREEVDRLNKQIARTAVKYTNYEEKLQTRNNRIEALEKELKETNDKAIDPDVFEKIQDKVQELMGESKHWQQKALSLSKEMQRAMAVQMELNGVKQELIETKGRIEELEAERTAFREAMQNAIAVSSESPTNRPQNQTTQSPTQTARQWLNNFL